MRILRNILTGAMLLLAGDVLRAADVPATQTAEGLRVAWAEADHPSGVYYAKAAATLNVMVENPTAESRPLEGTIAFGVSGATAADFKAISLTPISTITLLPNERAKLPLAFTFAAAGPYELRWIHPDKSFTVIEGPAGVSLQAIFAPRVGNNTSSPWLTTLPRQAGLVPGYLGDLVAQTTVRKFLMDERFAYDPETNIGLGVGASLTLSTEQTKTLFADVSKAKAFLVLRVAVPIKEPPGEKTLAAFRRYIADGAARMNGTLKGIAIVPEDPPTTMSAEQRAAYRDFYLAGYDEAKKSDKTIALLGAGTAEATRDLLFAPTAEGKRDELRAYVDAVAITDVIGQPGVAQRAIGEGKIPLWVLPPASANPWPLVPAAAALAEDAVVVAVPPPGVDRGVTAHLLGGAVFFHKLHPEHLPYVAVFQGDGYAVAAVAGLAANTPADAVFAGLARTRSVVSPVEQEEKPGYPNVEVPDDTRSMRVVDGVGSPVDCRMGDMLFVPAEDRIVYVLQSGNAEDLMAMLLPAAVNRMPVVEVGASSAVVGEGDLKRTAVTLRLTNISLREESGSVKIIVPPTGGAEGKGAVTLGEGVVGAIGSGKTEEVVVEVAGELPRGPVIVEVTTKREVQRTVLVIPGAGGAGAVVAPATLPATVPAGPAGTEPGIEG